MGKKLSEAQMRALRAVEAGKVTRIYRENRNVLHSDGIASRTLWTLDRMELIRDGESPGGAGVLSITCVQVLTAAGRAALASGERE